MLQITCNVKCNKYTIINLVTAKITFFLFRRLCVSNYI